MVTFLYRCPVTGYRVQGLSADNPTNSAKGPSYEPVRCTICARIHLVDPRTGKLAGEDAKPGGKLA